MMVELEVYALEKISERCFKGFLKKDGSKIVLKPARDFSDPKVIQALHQIQMQSIPHIPGYCFHQDEKWLIHTWQAGQSLAQRKFPADKIELIFNQVKQIIQNLNRITNFYWFFPDLKPEHILEHNGRINLIDFEHVLLSKEKKIAWSSLTKIGITNRYCSADLKQEFLSLYHHDYALALLSLELIQGEHIQTLNRKTRKKLIACFRPSFQKELLQALQMKGFSEFQQNIQQNVWENKEQAALQKTDQSALQKTDRKKLSSDLSGISIKEKLKEYWEQFKNIQAEPNFIEDISLDDILSRVFSFFHTYLQKNLQEFCQKIEFEISEIAADHQKKKILKIRGIRIQTISPRYFMPIYNVLEITCLPKEFTVEDQEELIKKLFQLENNLLQPDLLTNFIASHIVKQYEISDFLINNQYIEITKEREQSFMNDRKSLYQLKKGVFAEDQAVS